MERHQRRPAATSVAPTSAAAAWRPAPARSASVRARISLTPCTATDVAGNTTGLSHRHRCRLSRRRQARVRRWRLTAGASYVVGSVTAGPTYCHRRTSTSGRWLVDDVTGYGTSVGSAHCRRATRHDNAGQRRGQGPTYTVLAWTLNGFSPAGQIMGRSSQRPRQPSASSRSAPSRLKFRVSRGATASPAPAPSVRSRPEDSCPSERPRTTSSHSTGGTSLRYDSHR